MFPKNKPNLQFLIKVFGYYNDLPLKILDKLRQIRTDYKQFMS